jgi:hypothetical protein
VLVHTIHVHMAFRTLRHVLRPAIRTLLYLCLSKKASFFKIHYFHVLTSPLKHLLGGLATPAAWRFSGWQLNKKYTGYISILKYVECRYMYWPTRCAWLICFSFFGLDVVELDFWLCQSYEFSHVRVSIHIVSQIFIGFTRFYLLA